MGLSVCLTHSIGSGQIGKIAVRAITRGKFLTCFRFDINLNNLHNCFVILGVDLGQKTTGLALSEGHFAYPYKTIRHKSIREAVTKIAQICDELGVEKLVVGFVEGKIKSYFQNFVKNFKKEKPGIEVILRDETLTSRQARELQIKLQVPKLKRREKEHEVAASIILQSFLDSND